jgi:hypothetical protein
LPLDQRHLYLQLISQRSRESHAWGVVSSYSVGGSASRRPHVRASPCSGFQRSAKRVVLLRGRVGSQPQRDVGWLHRVSYHAYQVFAQGVQVGFVS